MRSSYGTSSPVATETRFCLMRDLDLPSSWWKRTSLEDVALNTFTGTFTSPKLMAPLQMGLGTSRWYVGRSLLVHWVVVHWVVVHWVAVHRWLFSSATGREGDRHAQSRSHHRRAHVRRARGRRRHE